MTDDLDTLRERHQMLQDVIDGTPLAIYTKDRDGCFQFVNRTAAARIGLPQDEIVGRPAREFAWVPDYDAVAAQDRRVLETGAPSDEHLVTRDPQGHPGHWAIHRFALRDATGEIAGVAAIAADVSERRTLARQESLSAELARRVAEGLDGAALAAAAAEAALAGTGASAALLAERRPGPTAVAHAGEPDASGELLALAGAALTDARAVRAGDLLAVPVYGDGEPYGALALRAPGTTHDEPFLHGLGRLLSTAHVRARARELESALAGARRLEAVGRLAGGIAHDFNNLLAVISNCAAFAAEAATGGDKQLQADLAEIRAAAEKATDLTRRLLLFAREDTGPAASCRPNDVITALAYDALPRRLGASIRLEIDLDPAAGPLALSAYELEQALLALADNARAALPGGGTVAVRSACTAQRLEIRVADTGSGMRPDVAERAFEPFFTTHPPGRNPGLGLAVVHGIMRRSGGTASLESDPSSGTVVVLSWPAGLARSRLG